MRKINLVPNLITAFGLACGLFVVFKSSMPTASEGAYQILQGSVWLLLLAAFADLLDGAVARAIRAESEFGVVFDTLADAVSFGVAPSILFLSSLRLEQGTWLAAFSMVSAMLFSLCGILRLVRFNVKAAEAKGNDVLMEAQKKHFTGLPIPAAALAAVSANLLLSSSFLGAISEEFKAFFLGAVMVVLGFFMVSVWKFPSLKVLHFRLSSFYLVFITAILALFVLYGVLYFFPFTLFISFWGYIVLGWVLSIIRLIAGKKSKTLEDFEPDEDE